MDGWTDGQAALGSKQRGLPEALAVHCVAEMCRCLKGLWAAGLLHCDVKPDNFLLHLTRSTPHDHEQQHQDDEGPLLLELRVIDLGQSVDRLALLHHHQAGGGPAAAASCTSADAAAAGGDGGVVSVVRLTGEAGASGFQWPGAAHGQAWGEEQVSDTPPATQAGRHGSGQEGGPASQPVTVHDVIMMRPTNPRS